MNLELMERREDQNGPTCTIFKAHLNQFGFGPFWEALWAQKSKKLNPTLAIIRW